MEILLRFISSIINQSVNQSYRAALGADGVRILFGVSDLSSTPFDTGIVRCLSLTLYEDKVWHCWSWNCRVVSVSEQ
jgi:hypothetical protein